MNIIKRYLKKEKKIISLLFIEATLQRKNQQHKYEKKVLELGK
jgi:hypothetical protein